MATQASCTQTVPPHSSHQWPENVWECLEPSQVAFPHITPGFLPGNGVAALDPCSSQKTQYCGPRVCRSHSLLSSTRPSHGQHFGYGRVIIGHKWYIRHTYFRNTDLLKKADRLLIRAISWSWDVLSPNWILDLYLLDKRKLEHVSYVKIQNSTCTRVLLEVRLHVRSPRTFKKNPWVPFGTKCKSEGGVQALMF